MKRRATSGPVQMFSFLDAMVCTLGALLVLLHAFARHGQIEAVRKAEARAEQSGDDPQAEREMLEWQVEQLKLVREKTEAQLADERLKLSHVEDHERRLQEKLQQLEIAVAELERLKETSASDRDRQQAALEAAQSKLAAARRAVEDARLKGRHDASYSVVPYEGPNQTRRRPIYIECRADAMILQPEGISLRPGDFAGFLGAGNPLASALRGEREYFARQSPAGKTENEPYPLLLVRPEGVKTYYAARAALDSWGSDFGYELVGADWNLKFSEPDPQLTQLLRQIVADSRRRMHELMVATAQLGGNRSRTTLHASSHGGFVAEGSRGGGRGNSRGTGSGGWDSLDSDWASGGSGSGEGTGNDATAGGGVGGSNVRGGFGGTGTADGDARAGETAAGGQPGGKQGTSPYDPSGTGGQFSGQPGGTEQGQAGGTGSTRGQPGGKNPSTAGGPYANAAQSGGSASGQAGAKSGSQSGAQSGSQSSGQPGTASESSAGASSGSSGGSASGESSQSTTVSIPHSTIGSRKTTSLSKTRGRDWGLPDGGMGMSPATRPILVECYNDRLVIVSDDRNIPSKETPLPGETRANIDEFVSNVWVHMKGWGMAGKGLYWKPTLVMTVQPGAADRYAEIKALLADSGLEVRERQPRAANRPPGARPSR